MWFLLLGGSSQVICPVSCDAPGRAVQTSLVFNDAINNVEARDLSLVIHTNMLKVVVMQ